MDSQKKGMLWRIPLLAGILAAIFWGVWSFFGEVPSTSQIKMIEKWIIELPFSVSRWWDVLFAPIWAFIFVLIFSSERIKKNEDVIFGLGAGLVAGLVAGLGAGLVAGLGVGLGVGLVFLVAGLGVGLVFLVFGLVAGLDVGLGVGLGIGLGVGLGVGLKYMFSRKLWTKIGQWLAGK